MDIAETTPSFQDETTVLQLYPPTLAVFDELIAKEGIPREHWRPFLEGLARLDPENLEQHWETAQRLIRENGITYNVYAGKEAEERPWQLDTVPLLIPEAEWRLLEKGLQQRSLLLNLILQDLYGPQSLLKEGWIPPALVFGNPHFLRACHGITPAQDVWLHLHAVDLARGPDGRWWVLGDRGEAPSGAGYALENRLITARCLPDLFLKSNVRRLAPFFKTIRNSLMTLTGQETPRIVLLTPGPLNETYFEHSYLARYLGFTLAEGGDLTVRDDRVYLKTLDGLKRVDLILRRMDASFCDPLELRSDSAIGIPGLVQAVRAGNVVIANSLGSALIECQALMSFLPGLCRHLLDEELLLPSAATWWCGDAKARNYVRDHFDHLVIAPTFFHNAPQATAWPSAFGKPTLGSDFTLMEKEAILRYMARRGYDLLGQEPVTLSTTPRWTQAGVPHFSPSPMALRVFMAADLENGGYQVMPGGMTRFSQISDTRALSMQSGDGSKDSWVISETPEAVVSLLPSQDHPLALKRSGIDLPSRAADNLYWLGRYCERTEAAARTQRNILETMTVDLGEDALTGSFSHRLVDLLNSLGLVGVPFAIEDGQTLTAKSLRKAIAQQLFDHRQASSIAASIAEIHRIASNARDRLSGDAWRIMNRLRQILPPSHPQTQNASAKIHPWHRRASIGDMLTDLEDILRTLAAFSGMSMENTTRSLGWRFLDMGRRIERAMVLLSMIHRLVLEGDPEQNGALEHLLALADSFMTYRDRYMAAPKLAPTLDLLLTDESNPRSVAFQLAVLEDHITSLPQLRRLPDLSPEESLILAQRTGLRLTDIHSLCQEDSEGKRQALETKLLEIGQELANLSNIIARTHFSHAQIEILHEMRSMARQSPLFSTQKGGAMP